MTSGSIQASPAATEQQSAPEDTGKDTEDTKNTKGTQRSAKKGTKRRRMRRTPMGSHQKAETRALLAAMVSLAITYVATTVFLEQASAIWLISGRKMLAAATIIAVSSFIMFIIGYARTPMMPVPKAVRALRRLPLRVLRRVIEACALSIVFSATAFFMSYALLSAVNTMMGKDLFDSLMPGIVGAFAGVASYLGFIQASSLSAKAIATMLPLFVISGVTVAALTSDDPWWWHNNFSQLGDRTTFAAQLFNATLILAGLCIIIVTYFASFELTTTQMVSKGEDDSPDATKKTHTDVARIVIFSLLLSLTGVGLIGVGSFRYTPHPVLHNVFARGMSVPMGLLLVLLPWLMPQLSRFLYAFSYMIVAVDCCDLLRWLKGDTTLTSVEALACLTLFAWVIAFSRQIAAIQADRIQARILAAARSADLMVSDEADELAGMTDPQRARRPLTANASDSPVNDSQPTNP
ncbi:ABC transporter permease [Pseudoscardovia suis]